MRIAIIGAGPRGMLALERILSWNEIQPVQEKLEINIFDPYSIGGRVWTVDQPHELIMNTAAQDITLFTDQSVVMSGVVNMGPSLAQWSANYAHNYLVENNYSEIFLDEIKQITPNSYTSRALYGIYIQWFYDEQLKRLNDDITVNLYSEEVTNITQQDDKFVLDLANEKLTSNIVVAALGNLFNEPTPLEAELTEFANKNNLTYVRPNFAGEVELDNITADMTLAIKGLGLNFYDLMARLTYGRGGKFEPLKNGELTYHPSGKEPRIIAGSLHGLPNHSKGRKQKAPGEEYIPNFLNIATLQRYDKGTLSYNEFWTMLENEMSFVYYSNLIDEKYAGKIDKAAFQSDFLQDPETTLNNLKIDADDFINWESFIYPVEASTAKGFDTFVENFVKKDFQEAAKGTKTGPLTSALEVLRDIRATIRYVIENELLSRNEFVDKFMHQFNSINNLLSMGPPASRLQELHALLKAGIIKIVPGEMQVTTGEDKYIVSSKTGDCPEYPAEALIEARIPKISLSDTTSELMNNLVKNGMVKNWQFQREDGKEFVSGAVGFDRTANQLVDANGKLINNFYFWGVPTEGKNWLTTASPRPFINDPSLRTVDKIVSDIWKKNVK